MKFLETHFDEYIVANNKTNLHPKLDKVFAKFPNELSELGNLIFYGPSGVGKYTQVLRSIKKYSPTELKYEKKISVQHNKDTYFVKISDIHYEVNMSLLGCNSKILWHDIYQQITDILSSKPDKNGIIVCKDFHSIHNDLLDIFYSYMRHHTSRSVNIKFILITEEISFLPDNILNCCEIINIDRPSKAIYSKCIEKKIGSEVNVESITNIKSLKVGTNELIYSYKIICDRILDKMLNINELKFLPFRDALYDIFIYNLDITDCVWYILHCLISQNKVKNIEMSDILVKTYQFLKYYNNNYRPIYHLESYLFYLISIIHGFNLK